MDSQVDQESYDVLIVGGGLAGIRAAIAAAEMNPRLRIGMVSKVYPMRSHTVSAEGGAAAALGPGDSYETHAFDTVKGSDYLADQDVVDAFVREAPVEIIQMEHWGCPWSRNADGTIAVRPFGGMTTWRTVFAADKSGFHMLHTVFQTSLKYPQIKRHDEAFVTKLLVEDSAASPRSRPRRRSSPPAAWGASTPSRRTATSAPAMACRSRTAPASASRTWRWCSSIPPACPSRAS